MSDPVLQAGRHSALLTALATGQHASIEGLNNMMGPSTPPITLKQQRIPLEYAAKTIGVGQLPKWGNVTGIQLHLTIRADIEPFQRDDTHCVQFQTFLASGWAFGMWDKATLNTSGAEISTVYAPQAFLECLRRSRGSLGMRAGEVISNVQGPAAVAGWQHPSLGHSSADNTAATISSRSTNQTRSEDYPGTSQYVSAAIDLPFGVFSGNNSIDTGFVEALEVQISWSDGFNSSRVNAGKWQSRLDGGTPTQLCGHGATVVTKQRSQTSASEGRLTSPDGLGYNRTILGTGLGVNYFNLEAPDQNKLAVAKYGQKNKDAVVRSHVFLNGHKERKVVYKHELPGGEVEVNVELLFKGVATESIIMIHESGNISKTPVPGTADAAHASNRVWSHYAYGSVGGQTAVGVTGTQNPAQITSSDLFSERVVTGVEHKEFATMIPVNSVVLNLNGSDYWEMDNNTMKIRNAIRVGNEHTYAPASIDHDMCVIPYSLKTGASYQNSGALTVREIAGPCYKVRFNAKQGMSYDIECFHKSYNILSFNPSNGAISGSMSL